MPEVKSIFHITCEHGEGPVWDPVDKKLYWVDLLKGRYHKADVSTGEVTSFETGQPLGVLALRAGQGLVMALRDGLAFWNETEQQLRWLHTPENENKRTRFNDGAVDPAGRFFAGTMTYNGNEAIGNLYSLDTDLRLTNIEQSLLIPNGMGWSADNQSFYLTDTNNHVIYTYDYEITTGSISNRRNFIQFDKDEFPDGMCMDNEGNLWIAMWGGGKVCCYNQTGKKISEFPVPVEYPTSCCFGGDNMQTLFITSSQLMLTEKERAENPYAGKILMLETKAVGRIQPRFNA